MATTSVRIVGNSFAAALHTLYDAAFGIIPVRASYADLYSWTRSRHFPFFRNGEPLRDVYLILDEIQLFMTTLIT